LPKEIPALSAIHTVVFDFDGVFTDNKIWVDQDGRESVRCDRGDGLAFDLVRVFQLQGRLTPDFFILSKETNPVVLARARKLKLSCHQCVGDKLGFMTEYLATRMPDQADPFAPADAHPLVCKSAHRVLAQRGGEGFIRAFIELLLGIDQLSAEEIDELVSHC
jgi:3-deoxy-D-manno-octulosonate 8-phosphate phosphatase (KDO 8-P phosphatase)